ncbi:MAG: molybdopterin-binding protein [Pseudomonadota bacterium]
MPSNGMSNDQPTAAVLLIGDEILSGRTRDINLQQIATYLAPLGIPVVESRTVADVQASIVKAVNELRVAYTYVFTTGGIGPTHDDITADAIAAAFGVGIGEHPEVIAMLSERYAEMKTEFTPARRRMARIPHGRVSWATLFRVHRGSRWRMCSRWRGCPRSRAACWRISVRGFARARWCTRSP